MFNKSIKIFVQVNYLYYFCKRKKIKMRKKEFIKKIAKKADFVIEDTEEVMEAFLDVLST